jgi:hypothetical protein
MREAEVWLALEALLPDLRSGTSAMFSCRTHSCGDVHIPTNIGRNWVGVDGSPGERLVTKADQPRSAGRDARQLQLRVNFGKDRNPLPTVMRINRRRRYAVNASPDRPVTLTAKVGNTKQARKAGTARCRICNSCAPGTGRAPAEFAFPPRPPAPMARQSPGDRASTRLRGGLPGPRPAEPDPADTGVGRERGRSSMGRSSSD